jgi:hypothetical protein
LENLPTSKQKVKAHREESPSHSRLHGRIGRELFAKTRS